MLQTIEQPGEFVRRFLEHAYLPVTPTYECPYLPDRAACTEAFHTEVLDPRVFVALMDAGFRRSGCVIYRPVCQKCSACRPLRVPVEGFSLSRSQRRVWRRNQDLLVEVGEAGPTRRKWRIYCDYLDAQHDATMSRSWSDFKEFLYDSPVDTIEVRYRLGRRLVAISVVDRAETALNSVYVYFDPAYAIRSLGTYSALWEIDYCRRQGIPYYYLGFWIAGSPKMAYKANFQPCEVLDATGRWTPHDPKQTR